MQVGVEKRTVWEYLCKIGTFKFSGFDEIHPKEWGKVISEWLVIISGKLQMGEILEDQRKTKLFFFFSFLRGAEEL